MSKIEFTRILPWRAIALLRTCSGYAERSRNIELVKIRATYQVAIKTIENVSCIFVKFVGYKNQGQNYLFSTDHLPAKLSDLPTNIFSYTRAGIARFEPHYPQDNFHYQQDNFRYLQDNFSAHIR